MDTAVLSDETMKKAAIALDKEGMYSYASNFTAARKGSSDSLDYIDIEAAIVAVNSQFPNPERLTDELDSAVTS